MSYTVEAKQKLAAFRGYETYPDKEQQISFHCSTVAQHSNYDEETADCNHDRVDHRKVSQNDSLLHPKTNQNHNQKKHNHTKLIQKKN